MKLFKKYVVNKNDILLWDFIEKSKFIYDKNKLQKIERTETDVKRTRIHFTFYTSESVIRKQLGFYKRNEGITIYSNLYDNSFPIYESPEEFVKDVKEYMDKQIKLKNSYKKNYLSKKKEVEKINKEILNELSDYVEYFI